MGNSIFDESRVILAYSEWLNADGTSDQGVGPGGNYETRVDAIWSSNSDSIDHVLQLGYDESSTRIWIGSCTVPARAGYDGAPTFDVLAACLPVDTGGILLPPAGFLRFRLDVAVTGSEKLTVVVQGGYL